LLGAGVRQQEKRKRPIFGCNNKAILMKNQVVMEKPFTDK
jgi:hypothetical protein